MYKLSFTNSDFKPNGLSKEQVPLLIKEDLSFEEIPTIWFFHLAIGSGKTPSPDTWRSYAEAIVDFFNTCEVNKWDWKNITKDNLIAYRNNMLYNNNAFGRPYSKTTINNYVTRISLFYEWAYKNKYIKEVPIDKELIKVHKNIKNQYLMGHLNKDNVIFKNDLTLKTQKRIPHCLNREEFSKIISELKERNSLIVKWSVLTGMRRKEVLGLKLEDIPLSSNVVNQIHKMTINITKGSKPRDIYAPQELIDETNKYIKFTRREIAKKFNTFGKVDAVWISEKNGKPIGKKTIEAAFREAVIKSKVDCTFHHLRHTYAIKLLSLLTKQSQTSGLNPLKTLQLLLGHTNINTTMIYLESLNIDINEIEQSLLDLYEDII
jgi:integrase